MLPVIIVREMLERNVELSLLVQYVDNDGVTDALVKGFSNVLALQTMLHEFVKQEVKLSSVTWTARVPSASNPADAPSRSSIVCKDGYDRGLDRSIEALVWASALCALFLR